MKTQAVQKNELTMTANKALTVKMALITAYSFLICRAEILGSMSPFAICFTAAMPIKYAWITLLGSGLGYLSMGLTQERLIYLAILALVFLGKLLLSRTRLANNTIAASVLTLASFGAVIAVANAQLNFTLVDIGLRTCEALIASGVTCFSSIALNAMFHQNSLKKYNSVELSSTAILFMLVVSAMMDFQLAGFQLGVIAAAVSLLAAVYQFGAVGGAAAGVVMAVALNLYSTDYLTLGAVLVVSSLVAGMFRPVGRIVQTAVFLSMSLFSVFVLGMNLTMLFYLMDIIIGCGIFFMIPKKYLSILDLAGANVKNEQTMKDNIESRLDFAAQTISDLQNSLEQVSQKLNQIDTHDIGIVYNKTANYVCKNCGLNLFCWDEHYNDTIDSFQSMLKTVKQNGRLQPEDLDEHRILNCCRKNLLAQKFNQYYQEYTTAENAKRRVGEVRSIAVEQLSGVSQMLWEVSDEIANMRDNDVESAKVIYDVFEELATPPTNVFCTMNQYDRMEIDIYTLTGVEFDHEELRETISHALKRDFAMPSVSTINNKVRVSFYEAANFSVDFGACQVSSSAESAGVNSNGRKKICGDSYEYFLDNKGNAFLILSDGMGSGNQAALDSAMTCSIILKLIKAGFGLDSIIKFVNSSLQAKSVGESLSTIDIVKIDLYTGQAEFYKAGSAMSFIKLDRTIGEVRTNSLPVGILQGVEFDKQSILLSNHDMAVLVSDGVLVTNEKILKQLLLKHSTLPAKDLAHKLCEAALLSLGDDPHDDLTVLVAKVEKGV